MSHTQSSFMRPMCPSDKAEEDLDPHKLQGTWIMHGANAASSASNHLLLPLCQHRPGEEERAQKERGRMGVGSRGRKERGGVALRGLRKGAGIQKENWSGQRKERKDRILKREKKRGRVLKRVKRAAPKEMKGESCWRGRGNKEEKVEGDRVRSSGGGWSSEGEVFYHRLRANSETEGAVNKQIDNTQTCSVGRTLLSDCERSLQFSQYVRESSFYPNPAQWKTVTGLLLNLSLNQ